MGFVYAFDVIHLKDGPTRYKHLFFYTVIAIENGALLAAWYTWKNRDDVRQLEPCVINDNESDISGVT